MTPMDEYRAYWATYFNSKARWAFLNWDVFTDWYGFAPDRKIFAVWDDVQ